MDSQIKISAKRKEKGESEYKIISLRMKDELLDKIEKISMETNRSRNEVINLLLESAIEIVVIEK